MQLFKLKLMFIGLMLVFSSKLSAEINCPPMTMIKDITFLSANGAAGIWDLISAPFQYSHRDWELLFTVYLPTAENNRDALSKGTEYYKYEIDFFEHPHGIESSDRQTCYYAQKESSYFVRAISYA